jgi:hypothetical protein
MTRFCSAANVPSNREVKFHRWHTQRVQVSFSQFLRSEAIDKPLHTQQPYLHSFDPLVLYIPKPPIFLSGVLAQVLNLKLPKRFQLDESQHCWRLIDNQKSRCVRSTSDLKKRDQDLVLRDLQITSFPS